MFNSIFGAERRIGTKYKEKMTKVVSGQEANPQYTWKNVGATAAHFTVATLTCVVIVKGFCMGMERVLAD